MRYGRTTQLILFTALISAAGSQFAGAHVGHTQRPVAEPGKLRCELLFAGRTVDSVHTTDERDALLAMIDGSRKNWVREKQVGAKLLNEHIDHVRDLLVEKRSVWTETPGTRDFVALWEQALGRLDQMNAFVQAVKDPVERTYHQNIFDAAVAAVFKHGEVILSSRNPANLDIARIYKIIGTIANFDETNPAFSLYKTKREILSRYSLKEFTLCK